MHGREAVDVDEALGPDVQRDSPATGQARAPRLNETSPFPTVRDSPAAPLEAAGSSLVGATHRMVPWARMKGFPTARNTNLTPITRPSARLLLAILLASVATGCRTPRAPGEPLHRCGDEIIVCGRLFHTGTPVITWLDPGGYDAYRVERRFAPPSRADWNSSRADNPELDSPNRYGSRRFTNLPPADLDRIATQGWDLPTLQRVVDQFVIHFDATGTSRRCFEVLHDLRGLSVHFLLDVDGTLYQTLDLKERAWHATSSNTRAIGIEIASVGAVPLAQRQRLDPWYTASNGITRLVIPDFAGHPGIRTPGFQGHPARPDPVIGRIQNETLIQYDFTPQQYHALAQLTATLCRVFPRIPCDYPRDPSGAPVNSRLDDARLATYSGLLGHYHIQSDKVDPGPAFQWDRVVREARRVQSRRFQRPNAR